MRVNFVEHTDGFHPKNWASVFTVSSGSRLDVCFLNEGGQSERSECFISLLLLDVNKQAAWNDAVTLRVWLPSVLSARPQSPLWLPVQLSTHVDGDRNESSHFPASAHPPFPFTSSSSLQARKAFYYFVPIRSAPTEMCRLCLMWGVSSKTVVFFPF